MKMSNEKFIFIRLFVWWARSHFGISGAEPRQMVLEPNEQPMRNIRVKNTKSPLSRPFRLTIDYDSKTNIFENRFSIAHGIRPCFSAALYQFVPMGNVGISFKTSPHSHTHTAYSVESRIYHTAKEMLCFLSFKFFFLYNFPIYCKKSKIRAKSPDRIPPQMQSLTLPFLYSIRARWKQGETDAHENIISK